MITQRAKGFRVWDIGESVLIACCVGSLSTLHPWRVIYRRQFKDTGQSFMLERYEAKELLS